LLLDEPLTVLKTTASEMWLLYSGGALKYSINAYSFAALTTLGLLSLWHMVFRAPRHPSRWMLAIFPLLVLLIPFGINLATGGKLPTRSLVALPLAFWLFTYAALKSPSRSFVTITLLTLTIVSFQTSYIGNIRQAISAVVRDYQIATAAALYERIVEAQPLDFDMSTPIKVEFYGAIPYRPPYPRADTSTVGKTFFNHDKGDPLRIFYYMKLVGYSNVQLAYPIDLQVDPESEHTRLLMAKRAALIPHFEKMPVWPARGSVKRLGHVTLVRLNREPGFVHLQPQRLQ
jgi:hypothetical protein